jgi:hypothetical protein
VVLFLSSDFCLFCPIQYVIWTLCLTVISHPIHLIHLLNTMTLMSFWFVLFRFSLFRFVSVSSFVSNGAITLYPELSFPLRSTCTRSTRNSG